MHICVEIQVQSSWAVISGCPLAKVPIKHLIPALIVIHRYLRYIPIGIITIISIIKIIRIKIWIVITRLIIISSLIIVLLGCIINYN